MNRCFLVFTLVMTLAIGCASVEAAIVYVDANDANTVDLATGNPLSSVTSGSQSGTDGLWTARSFANESTVYQAQDQEDAAELATTVTLPGPGVYQMYAYYWTSHTGGNASNAPNEWDLQVKDVNTGVATLYDPDGFASDETAQSDPPAIAGIDARTQTFANAVITEEGDRSMWAAPAGLWDTSVGGLTVSVLVDSAVRDTFPTVDQRSWYDGVGYEPIPEPASLLLVSWSVLGLGLSGRRRTV